MIFGEEGREEFPISVDLETLGLHPFSAIIQIGAVSFDRAGRVRSEFSILVNPKGQRTADTDTLKWWLDQGEAGVNMLHSALSSPVTLRDALMKLSGWMRMHTPGFEVFDGPVLFRGNKDMSWLENAYDTEELTIPFKFRNVHEQRQFMRTAVYMGFDELTMEREGRHHDALEDAKYQAQCAAAAVRHIDRCLMGGN